MARRRRRIKTIANASRDLISELPVEVKDRILECLSTRDAARTALLSRHLNHVWLHHGRLAFDGKFLQSVKQKQCRDDYGRTFVNIINNILFFRAGPVKKFTLEINAENDPSPSPDQSEFHRKCEGDKPVGLVNIINHILLNRAGPVKKFSLCISCPELEGPKPQQSDIDRWCLYLS
nr:F-box/FBD/LRR-repeat protein At1g13570-like [Ipomoea batatas]